MAKYLDPRTTLKRIAIPLLADFFQRQGELHDLPWEEITRNRATDAVYDAWRQLPDERRRTIQATLRDVLELADHHDVKAMAEEVAARAPERAWEFTACRSHFNKVVWFYLNFPGAFQRAANFARADALSSGRQASRFQVPKSTRAYQGEATAAAIAAALNELYWPNVS